MLLLTWKCILLVIFILICDFSVGSFLFFIQLGGRLLISNLSGESGPRAASFTLQLQHCHQCVSQNRSYQSSRRKRSIKQALFPVCHVCSSAVDGRHYPCKPLRDSQSRLLVSTPSWTDSDSTADREKGLGNEEEKEHICPGPRSVTCCVSGASNPGLTIENEA